MDRKLMQLAKVALAAGLSLASVQPVRAQADTPTGVWFAGGTVSDTISAYGGAIKALPGARLGKGLALRGSVNGGTYHYDGATEIDASYAGAEAALVYQISGPWGWANVAAGPRYTYTDLSPDDPGNKRQGSRWDVGLQTDGAFDGPAWRLGWIASVGPFDGAYEARAQLGRKLGGQKYRLGVEGGITGNPTYSKTMAGAFVAASVAPNMDLQLGAGATFQEGRKARAYGSIGLSKVF
ncbi:cellulose biosynthesis protein BcsS [Rhizorhapis sp.]|uniref:cellulose biosynthesis protein BcsS n=1 Tax=Rhizorhapis sp. TaxID=1968842 RepID=UPI002B4A2F22|nr:cellulose biosynthesis protein BcsS [Rhizorhapis sp.]HKR18416.1 cellulose biosynthesis protein BcsS [Rhizorhapis sp.]